MKYALWITGFLACLAVVFPEFVVLGYFFLIVPGVILTIAPTVFVYLAGTAAVRRVLPIASPLKATAVSFCLVLALGWIVMQPFRSSALKTYAKECQPDIVADLPIELRGHVRIEATDSRKAPDCDYLCLSVLDSARVESVTIVTAGRRSRPQQQQSAAYTLESAEANPTPGLFPSEPGQIVREFRPLTQTFGGSKLLTSIKAVEADWAVRLADRSRLRKIDPVAADAADWVIRIDRRSSDSHSTIRRVTICDSAGQVRFRKSYIERRVPAAMFFVGFKANFGGGTLSGASFSVGRQRWHAGERSLHLQSELLSAIRFRVPECDPRSITRLRGLAVQALNDPEASEVQLDLARRYLGLFYFDATEQDHELIAEIVSDPRVRNIDDQLMNVFSKKKTPTAMRNAYAERITMDHTSAELRRWLAESMAGLPVDTFAIPTAAHYRIWNSPELYRDAGAFLCRTADLGATQALPVLRAALDAAITIPTWSERRPLIEGIREAFVQLGPSAFSEASRVSELFLLRPSPLMNNARQADQWRFALARMGVDVSDLPFFPNQSTSAAQRISQKVAQKLRRYEQDLVAKSE
ncbi:hypothetical protein [Fuerstiella marisgermanici]|uniref:Uncharacterized protein n=1 Tax=Fuerstiella marisgermanici TaxID=1891926 RepID=A0A1P8WQ70_9PLAN|nr:hypothetical protein [Fuerstiella marisgermanici]APZ96184.1 hypothetical protein Fuma_05852 [Fuerstiella marisgermanici]